MLKLFAAVALASALPLTSAIAAPAANGPLPQIQLVDMHRGHDRNKGHSHGARHRGFSPGHKYGRAPHGWRSYRSRPGDWRTRGCVVVGPLWYCP